MPDPDRKTVSASQVPALFGHHPWLSSFALWHHIAHGAPIEQPETERMRYGKLFERIIVQLTAEKYRLDVAYNDGNVYDRKGLLGCTIDAARLATPEGGEVIIEAKWIDYFRWKDTWTASAATPAIELQVQAQLAVRGAEMAIIAAMVGGNELLHYERRPDPKVIAEIESATAAFFDSIAKNQPPEPHGLPMEIPVLAALYPEAQPRKVLTIDDLDVGEQIRMWDWAHNRETEGKKTKEALKPKLMALAGDAGVVLAPGARLKIRKSPVKPWLCECGKQTIRKGYVQTVLEAERLPDPELPPPNTTQLSG